jgi:hypothetical protein
MYKYWSLVIFLVLTATYYYLPFYSTASLDTVLSVTTFLLAILTGFFISRQATRYSTIREEVAVFDACISSVYRNLAHVDKSAVKEMKEIIIKHYHPILEYKWDYYISNKSTTLTDIHKLIDKLARKKNLKGVAYLGIEYSLSVLNDAQKSRKKMIALHKESVPAFQWVVIYILVAILLLVLSGIQSKGMLFESVFKAAFASAVSAVLILLSRFNKLQFYENNIGEKSAQDVLDIVAGVK